jgi:Domain of unknown function (DUF5666)
MRSKLFILTMAVAAVLTSCNRHEAMPTSSYGQRVVTGQVIMAGDVANSSPAGVEVSVVGTGMSLTLGGDGHFTFVGVPEGAELLFRRADGIDARTRISTGTSNVVELSTKTVTSNGGRRRGVSPKDPGPSQQIEGLVVSAAADKLVVHDSHGNDVTVAIDSTTLIRKGDQNVKATDLQAGDRVHVKAIAKNNVLTALQVIVQNEGQDDDNGGQTGQQQQIEGLIVKVSADSITVHDSHGNDVTAAITKDTVIRKGNQTVQATDLKPGDRVHVMATSSSNTLTATQIIVQQMDEEMEVEGTVTSVGTSSIVVKGITVNTDGNTTIRKQGKTIAVSDIKVGDEVSANGTRVDATTMLAKQIEVHGGHD